MLLRGANLPDHARPRDLDERTITVRYALRLWARLAELPHRTIIHYVGAPVGAELDVRWAIEPGAAGDERLLEFDVVGKPLDLQDERLTALMVVITRLRRMLAEVDQLDLVAHFGCRVGGIRLREPKISLEGVECSTRLDRPGDKGLGHEV